MNVFLGNPEFRQLGTYFCRAALSQRTQKDAFAIRAHVEILNAPEGGDYLFRQGNLILERLFSEHCSDKKQNKEVRKQGNRTSFRTSIQPGFRRGPVIPCLRFESRRARAFTAPVVAFSAILPSAASCGFSPATF
jgi:hypothetical protein